MTLFETPRLFVREVQPGDLDALLAVYGDPLAMRHVGDGQALDRAQCEAWVEVIAERRARYGHAMATLLRRSDGGIVGFCGLVHPNFQPDAELKYALRRECWGQGLATEAARGMLAHAGQHCGLERVIATVAPAHLASQRVLQKAGMQRGELRANEDGSFTQVYEWRRNGP